MSEVCLSFQTSSTSRLENMACSWWDDMHMLYSPAFAFAVFYFNPINNNNLQVFQPMLGTY